jgi:hypothetical protein
MAEDDELVIFNGIDGSSGDYLTPPLTVVQLSQAVQEATAAPEPTGMLQARRVRDTEAHLGVVELVADPQDLGQAGWGVIFPAEMPPTELTELKEALAPLLEWRKHQAGAEYYKEYSGPEGYRPGDTLLD